MLGAAAILVGGQQLLASVNLGPEAPGVAAGSAQNGASSASRADVERALVLVNGQIELAASTIAWWQQQPWTGPEPAAVRALWARMELLGQQKAALESILAAHDSIPQVSADLAIAEQQLAAIDRELQATPTGSPVQADVVRQLSEQRRSWAERRDQLAVGLTTATQQTQAAVLPDVTDQTTGLVAQVRALPQEAPPAPPASRERETPVAVVPREAESEEGDPVTIGAPPRAGREKPLEHDEEQPQHSSDDDHAEPVDLDRVVEEPTTPGGYQVTQASFRGPTMVVITPAPSVPPAPEVPGPADTAGPPDPAGTPGPDQRPSREAEAPEPTDEPTLPEWAVEMRERHRSAMDQRREAAAQEQRREDAAQEERREAAAQEQRREDAAQEEPGVERDVFAERRESTELDLVGAGPPGPPSGRVG